MAETGEAPVVIEVPEMDSRRSARSYVAAGIAATVVAAGGGLTYEAFARDGQDIGMACPAPSDESIATVTELFDHPPERPHLSGTNRFARGRELILYYHQQADKLGITLADSHRENYPDTELAPGSAQPPVPFQRYFDQTESVLEQLGIPLRLGPPEQSVDAKTPTSTELETNAAKNEMQQLTRIFTLAPDILLTHKVKEVALTAHGKVQGFGGFGGLALTDEGVLIVDLTNNAADDYATAPHELYHIEDEDECGNSDKAANDPGYTALNDQAAYAGDWPLPGDYLDSQPKSFDAVSKNYYAEEKQALGAREAGNMATACEDHQLAESMIKNVEMQTDYSFYNEVEDKAEIGKMIFEPTKYPDMLDHEVPVRRAKFLFLMARMYEKHASVVRYYALEYGLFGQQTAWNCPPDSSENK